MIDHDAPTGRSREAAAESLSASELKKAMLRPDIAAAHVLGSADRVARNLAAGENLWTLVGLLSAASLLATVPYGALSPVRSWWKVSVLFTGPLLICLPCLHVFLQFLGFRTGIARNLALSLVITAGAGLFTLGFFPIIWFIDATTRAGDKSMVAPTDLSAFLLGTSLFLGAFQMFRCLAAGRRRGEDGGITGPIVLWTPLLAFIVWRMAGVLEIRG